MTALTRVCGYGKSLKYGKLAHNAYLRSCFPGTITDLNRLMTTLTLLDCAFSFFANFPCRLTISEMQFDLPCEEIYYASPHPFSEQSFIFSRRTTLNEAFYSLFPQKSSTPTSNRITKSNPLGLNPMDMFTLIHGKLSASSNETS